MTGRRDDRDKRADETMRVRVRAKNPQIERKNPIDYEAETAMADRGDERIAAKLQPRVLMDEDATEIADRAPEKPRRRSSSKRKTAKPAAAPKPVIELPTVKSKPADVRVVPRSRLMMKGTDAAGALAAQARVERLENELPAARNPVLRLLRGQLGHQATSALDRLFGGEFENRDLRTAQQSPKRSAERLINLQAFLDLDLGDRAQVLAAIARDPRDVESIKSAERLLAAGVLPRLSARERTMLLGLFDALPSLDRAMLAALAERGLHGVSALEDRDFEDNALFLHLAALAGGDLAPAIAGLGVRSADVMALILATLAMPERIALEEAGDGVLAMIEFGLAESSPSECARLWRALISGDLSADLPSEGKLDLGALLGKPGGSLASLDTPLRMGLELLAGLARPKGAATRSGFIMPGGAGIDADVVARALGFLYGVGFTVAAGPAGALRQLERATADHHRVPPAFVSLLYDGGERLFVFDHLDGETVFLRAPHGTSTKPKGARRLDPERRVEDPARALESVSKAALMASVGVALVPRT